MYEFTFLLDWKSNFFFLQNRIFLEGNIQLDLSSYEYALRNSRPELPTSLAYQIVHFCLPKQYYSNISLGKKFLGKTELNRIIKKHESGEKVKLPLQYAWGFQDPYDNPFIGEFDQNLGQERIQSLISKILISCFVVFLLVNGIKYLPTSFEKL